MIVSGASLGVLSGCEEDTSSPIAPSTQEKLNDTLDDARETTSEAIDTGAAQIEQGAENAQEAAEEAMP